MRAAERRRLRRNGVIANGERNSQSGNAVLFANEMHAWRSNRDAVAIANGLRTSFRSDAILSTNSLRTSCQRDAVLTATGLQRR